MKTWLEVYPEFKQLKDWFVSKSYQVTVEEHTTYDSVTVKSDTIRGFFTTPNTESYPTTRGKFTADNEKCFNKISQCPMVVKVPCDLVALEKHLNFLGSDAGYNYSNSFSYLDDETLPFEV